MHLNNKNDNIAIFNIQKKSFFKGIFFINYLIKQKLDELDFVYDGKNKQKKKKKSNFSEKNEIFDNIFKEEFKKNKILFKDWFKKKKFKLKKKNFEFKLNFLKLLKKELSNYFLSKFFFQKNREWFLYLSEDNLDLKNNYILNDNHWYFKPEINISEPWFNFWSNNIYYFPLKNEKKQITNKQFFFNFSNRLKKKKVKLFNSLIFFFFNPLLTFYFLPQITKISGNLWTHARKFFDFSTKILKKKMKIKKFGWLEQKKLNHFRLIKNKIFIEFFYKKLNLRFSLYKHLKNWSYYLFIFKYFKKLSYYKNFKNDLFNIIKLKGKQKMVFEKFKEISYEDIKDEDIENETEDDDTEEEESEEESESEEELKQELKQEKQEEQEEEYINLKHYNFRHFTRKNYKKFETEKKKFEISKKITFFCWYLIILCYLTFNKKESSNLFFKKKINWYSFLLNDYQKKLNKSSKKRFKFRKFFFWAGNIKKKKCYIIKRNLRLWREQRFIHSFNWFFLKKKKKEKEKIIRQNKKYYNFFQKIFFIQKTSKSFLYKQLKFMKYYLYNFLWQKKFYILLKKKQQGVFFFLIKFIKNKTTINWFLNLFKNFQYKFKFKNLENKLNNQLIYSEMNNSLKLNFNINNFFVFNKFYQKKVLNNFLLSNLIIFLKNLKKFNLNYLNNFFVKWRLLLKNFKKEFVLIILKNLLKKNFFFLFFNKAFLYNYLTINYSKITLNYSFNNYYLNYFFNYLILYNTLCSRKVRLTVTARPNNTFFTISNYWGRLLISKAIWTNTRKNKKKRYNLESAQKKNEDKNWAICSSASVGSWTRKKGKVRRDYNRKLEMYKQLIFTLWRVNNYNRFYRYYEVVLKKVSLSSKYRKNVISFIRKRIYPLLIKKFFILWKLNIFSAIPFGGTRGIRPARQRKNRFFKKNLF